MRHHVFERSSQAREHRLTCRNAEVPRPPRDFEAGRVRADVRRDLDALASQVGGDQNVPPEYEADLEQRILGKFRAAYPGVTMSRIAGTDRYVFRSADPAVAEKLYTFAEQHGLRPTGRGGTDITVTITGYRAGYGYTGPDSPPAMGEGSPPLPPDDLRAGKKPGRRRNGARHRQQAVDGAATPAAGSPDLSRTRQEVPEAGAAPRDLSGAAEPAPEPSTAGTPGRRPEDGQPALAVAPAAIGRAPRAAVPAADITAEHVTAPAGTPAPRTEDLVPVVDVERAPTSGPVVDPSAAEPGAAAGTLPSASLTRARPQPDTPHRPPWDAPGPERAVLARAVPPETGLIDYPSGLPPELFERDAAVHSLAFLRRIDGLLTQGRMSEAREAAAGLNSLLASTPPGRRFNMRFDQFVAQALDSLEMTGKRYASRGGVYQLSYEGDTDAGGRYGATRRLRVEILQKPLF